MGHKSSRLLFGDVDTLIDATSSGVQAWSRRDEAAGKLREEAAAAREAIRLREQELARLTALTEAGEHVDGLLLAHRLRTQARQSSCYVLSACESVGSSHRTPVKWELRPDSTGEHMLVQAFDATGGGQ